MTSDQRNWEEKGHQETLEIGRSRKERDKQKEVKQSCNDWDYGKHIHTQLSPNLTPKGT